jgi:NADPH2:quinone reductase
MGVMVSKARGPEASEWAELYTPTPGRGEARIVQRAVGVNFIDVYLASGLYSWPLSDAAAARRALAGRRTVGATVLLP